MKGRREVWSDPEIQKLAANYVCVMDECFDLYPPAWLKDEWLENPDSTKLFRTYCRNAPKDLVPAGSSTHQGVYCMTADGGYLSGVFSFASKERTAQLLREGMARYEALAKHKGWTPKPIPQDRIELSLGDPPPPGGLKLRLAYRDFPRGANRYPEHRWVKKPFNLGWLDLTPEEAQAFVTESSEKRALPRDLIQKLSLHALKDSARGQFNTLKEDAFKGGELHVSCIAKTAEKLTIRVTGKVAVEGGGINYRPALFGIVEFDRKAKIFTRFDVLAVGQRSGAGQFNAREGDAAAAPLGVSFELHQSG